jgi:Ca-activated chloride channel family protein
MNRKLRPHALSSALAFALLAACTQVQERDATATDEQAPPPRVDAMVGDLDGGQTVAADASVAVEEAASEVEQVRVAGSHVRRAVNTSSLPANAQAISGGIAYPPASPPPMVLPGYPSAPEVNTERYEDFDDNPVQLAAENPVSTFSIDVDTGSYSNVRRMLMAGQRPPQDAVRVEEMINYFDYGYPAPTSREVPFRVTTEFADAPWDPRRQLLLVGIQGYEVPAREIPAANLVFLIDTSGSMQDEDKLPLVKASLRELAQRLRPQDRISIVVYAGSAGLVLPPTPGDQRDAILAALDRLEAGGSTNGGAGIELAYRTARDAFMPRGVNRVILATDGDFNVGTVSQDALETMVENQRESGVALTTLGFGTGNYNDAMAERLADVGNGNHAYIDSLAEGRKVLVEEMSSTLLTIAQDVKIQVEFNPAVVAEYRLIGYVNRQLRREDFNNDRVDAGEIGAGHDVTALYEITLVGSDGRRVDPLRYGGNATPAGRSDELGLLRLRYKRPGEERSRLIESAMANPARRAPMSDRMELAAAVAAYADRLRGGENVGGFGWDRIAALARNANVADPWNSRAGLLELIDRARALDGGNGGDALVSE